MSLSDFQPEAGGHRWQRIPPTERKGRVHTSTVTVTVAPVAARKVIEIHRDDVEESFMRGSGKGGQKRNKTDSAVRLTHKPTGISVRCESERSQSQNRDSAWKELKRRLQAQAYAASSEAESTERMRQAGSGMRGDKRRTYRSQDDIVTDHVTGKKASLGRILRGDLELLR